MLTGIAAAAERQARRSSSRRRADPPLLHCCLRAWGRCRDAPRAKVALLDIRLMVDMSRGNSRPASPQQLCGQTIRQNFPSRKRRRTFRFPKLPKLQPKREKEVCILPASFPIQEPGQHQEWSLTSQCNSLQEAAAELHGHATNSEQVQQTMEVTGAAPDDTCASWGKSRLANYTACGMLMNEEGCSLRLSD